MVTTRPVCAPCVRICTALLRRRQPIILILRPAPGAIALRELFCILGLLCHAAVALRFRDFLHHKISKNGGPICLIERASMLSIRKIPTPSSIQNDIGNRHSPTVIVAAITSRIKHHRLPTHVNLNGRQCGLHNESTIMLEQLRTLDKRRLLGYAGTVGKDKMREVNTALEISIGIKDLLLDNKRKRGSNCGKSEHREEKHQADPDDH